MSRSNINYQVLREAEARSSVYQWWQRVSRAVEADGEGGLPAFSTAVRPALRRAKTPDDALLTEGFRLLWFAVPDNLKAPRNMPALGCVAAVLAEVREMDQQKSFAAAMGSQVEKTGKPRVSELRFQQLQQSHDLEELQRRLRRAVALLGKKVHVLSLADNIMQWHREKSGHPDYRPDRRLPVRWATDYFTELASYQKAAATN
ncbi:CRISPR-associated protein [Halorhodospira halochloris]|uniref:CRISPR-associated protein n=1 Tax=Halorhodospira halochloris TaxID=1052 RepID=A0A0X8X8B2_HALHR|nr:type I-E CRISPR-associated protein Cse2/CasB [Halorhodospira halochloris]MBK1651142.1 type I-E CRISPR-associated protein Cse2/CasB [Halorhodospira halochloris]BAU57411.1 CRISPR-associated protein [Halorhodospira halochloris]